MPLCRRFARSDLGSVQNDIGQAVNPFEDGFFNGGFGELVCHAKCLHITRALRMVHSNLTRWNFVEVKSLLDFPRNLTDIVIGGSAAERLLVGGSKSIASFFVRCRHSCSPGCIRILDVDDAPTFEDLAILLTVSSKL